MTWAKSGNIDQRYSDLYKKVLEYRRNAKHLEEPNLGIIEKEVFVLLSTAHEFVEHIKNMLASLAYYRNQSLNYVKLIARIQKKRFRISS